MVRFAQELAPAKKENQIVVNDVRISALSSKIIRVEKGNQFIDNRTRTVYCRDFSDDKIEISQDNKIITIISNDRKYIIDTSTLDYRVFINDKEVYVDDRLNLKGTARTLDGIDGSIPLPNGLMSRSGLTVFDDSKSLLLNVDGSISGAPDNHIDFYIFAFGTDYLGGLKEFYKLCGPTPVIPKFALGNWWSRYHKYYDYEYLDLMKKFKDKNIPLTVAVIDMDWHIVSKVPLDVTSRSFGQRGWTGYTFEKKYFPDYKGFLKKLHEENFKTSLNLHPKDGVRYYETQYKDMAEANGIDPKSKKPVEFNLLDENFRNSYFDIIHHKYESDGVDFWWIDWQQGTKSKLKGVDPLWLLNHYHFLDINRDKQSIILSRYAGIGSHRYPLGFSGDTFVTWRSLNFQPYFTATASNVGYTWWSHDIGGHISNFGNNELYLRWLQLGCFSPINRLHSNNMSMSKEPWLYPRVEKEAIKFLQLRHKLIPYCYSAGIRTHNEGIPICAPLYYFYDDELAYDKKFRNQYVFNSNLIVCPVTKSKGLNKLSKLDIWLPKGKWVNIFNHEKYEGNRVITIECPLSEYPVFINEGNFLPLLTTTTNEIDYTKLYVKVFVGTGEYELLDDNGSIKFNIVKEDDGYNLNITKTGDICTKEIELEFIGINKENKIYTFDTNNQISDNIY